MGRIRFLWGVLWRDLGVTPRVYQAIGLIAPLILTWLATEFGIQISYPAHTIVGVTAAIFIVIVFLRLFHRAYELEAALKPRIEISDPVESTMPKIRGNNLALRFYSVTLTNLSDGDLKNCRVKMTEFINRRGEAATEIGMLFRLSRERHSKTGKHTFAQAFELNGKGDKVSIDIAALDEVNGSFVNMQYATAASEKVFYELHRSLFPHWLTIRVTADAMASVTKSFCGYVSEDGFLRMETVAAMPIAGHAPPLPAGIKSARPQFLETIPWRTGEMNQ
ncbi:hypothetical protein [Mesorhizobium sp.]|uniref:hypothetical protein n=1 Tax=Mesorhizobium sp. TaxID=1871066 RepID=UPI000FE4AEAC|nr:hypothetical protein [Mesorhizobium sp.]RWD96311.1 MAG: hypothetical protein EOS40_33445 [Mesorhizobium sp.]